MRSFQITVVDPLFCSEVTSYYFEFVTKLSNYFDMVMKTVYWNSFGLKSFVCFKKVMIELLEGI